MSGSLQADVAIVGAGPVGLTAACALRAAGASVLVFDEQAAGANTSRAAVVHARTLQMLESIDVTPRLVAEGIVVPLFTIRDRRRIVGSLDFSGLDTAYPFTLMLPQSRTEEILEQRLGELGGTVHRLHRVSAVRQDASGAVLDVKDSSGALSRVSARFVIGADGMHSMVREALGIGFEGGGYDESFVLADVEMHWPLSRTEVQLFLSPHGLMVVAPLPGGRHRIVATVDNAPEHPGIEEIQAIMDDRGSDDSRIVSVAWSSRFRVQHRLATRYRSGAIFLAGDAAHVHSPAGGQGMNTGIQDAIELSSVLVAAFSGADSAAAFDRYEAVRRPVAQGVIALTDRMTRGATLGSRPARVIRNAAIATALRFPAVNKALTLRIAELR